MRSIILKNINKIMLYTSSKYLDECVEAKNNILDIVDDLENSIKENNFTIDKLKLQLSQQQSKQEYLDKFKFISCEECVHKTDVYAEICIGCKHYYGCLFEKKERK